MGVFLFSIIEKLVNETEKEPSGAHHHRNWSSSPQSKQKRGCTLQTAHFKTAHFKTAHPLEPTSKQLLARSVPKFNKALFFA